MAQGIFTKRQQLRALVEKSWGVSSAPPQIEYLVVAGGGGGGGAVGGGGGAGGLLQGLLPVTSGNSYTVTVGSGGTNSTNYTSGSSGTNSIFSSITAIGGGFGGGYSPGSNGGSGGSGGGGGSYSGIWIGGAGTGGQGNSGGAGAGSSAGYAGGGGGAGTIGRNAYYSGTNDTSSYGGAGGAGIASAISGTVTAYAGGGGGASGVNGYNTGAGALGGVGGGGVGGSDTSPGSAGGNGTANTGGGGGGSRDTLVSGIGGSGIVIISYPDIYNAPASFGGANSPTASTSGSGSIYMNGSSGSGGGPYLSYPNSSTMQFSSGNFTIEAWCYFSVVQESTIIARYPFDNTNNEWLFQTSSSLVPFFSYSAAGLNTGGITPVTSGSALSINTWYHIAVVKNGTGVTLYINGTSVSTGTISGSIYSGTTTSTVGSYAQSAYPNGYAVPNGYLSNVRVVKGVAVYTSNFTPSTTPLTPISGTSLLLNTVSGSLFTDSSTNAFTPSTPSSFGKPTWNQLSPFATGLGYKNRVYTWTGSGTVTF